MFNSQKIYDHYGVSGLIMPYIWLIIYVYFHYLIKTFWFLTPDLLGKTFLIIHIVLTVIAIIFSHKVLIWAIDNEDKGVIGKFFNGIIDKMCDSPIELFEDVFKPLFNDEFETSQKVLKFLYYLVYTLITISFGYIIFIIVALILMVSMLIENKYGK